MRATITQLAAYVGVSERTIHRYLAGGKWAHTRLPGGLIEIDDSLLTQPEEGQEGLLLATLKRIEQKLDSLSASVSQLSQSGTIQPQARPSPARAAPVSGPAQRPDIPAGAVQVFTFARAHGIPPGTAKDQVKAGRLQDLAVESVSRPGEQEHYFTIEQQQAALQLWRYHPRFQACADCPHGA